VPALDQKGENLLRGFRNMMDDLKRSKGMFQVSTTKTDAFKVGENLATAKGKVVFQNDLMQLIQYAPTTQETYQTPILMIPAWINKYYILDLSEKNSLVRWLVDQGFTVFMISWVNPDKTLQHKAFEDYMLEGPLAAMDAIEKATGAKQVHAMGYCLGGTLLTATLAYLEVKKQERVKTATLITTLIDFEHAGQLGDLIDEKLVSSIEKEMLEKGYFDGPEMSAMFSMLRANDMIWSFVVHNYLLGETPFPFDILYWNADGARLPATMHSFYLRNMYLNNALVKKNGVTLATVPIDVSRITTPIYALATKEDHIAPWQATFVGAKACKNAPVRFVLSGSGHVAGVVNPPVAKKYQYWLNQTLATSSDKWFEAAKEYEGSWWLDWLSWAKPQSGKQLPAIKPGSGKLKPIEDAPGSYVKELC
jgi:polyhydroxyalkanoate synthase